MAAWAILLSLAAPMPAGAASITWDRVNPLQGCLAADRWLTAQVEILTNEDPATWRLDDMAVAKWTVETLASCKAKAGGDEATESRFKTYMAQWREHVQDLVDVARQESKPD